MLRLIRQCWSDSWRLVTDSVVIIGYLNRQVRYNRNVMTPFILAWLEYI